MVNEMKPIRNVLIVDYPKLLGIIKNRLNDHQNFKWLLQPMEIMVSGQPIIKNGSKKALMVGNYPKPTLSARDNDRAGLRGMFEKVKEHGDSEFRFRNQSMDHLRSILGELGQSKITTCEVIEKSFIALDIFPFQLFYSAKVPKLLDVLKDKFPVFYESYIAYMNYEFKSVSDALLLAGQEPSETPFFTLGIAPYKEFTQPGRHLNFLGGSFKDPVQTSHPCSLLDPRSICGKSRFEDSDETLTKVSRYITGNNEMNITYHKRYYEKNKAVSEDLRRRRSRAGYCGPDESEASKISRKIGSIPTRFSADDKLWSKNLTLALQYEIDNGEIPAGVPRRLRCKQELLSTKDKFDKFIITWTIKQRTLYHDPREVGPRLMAQWRKDKFSTSGLLLE